MPSEEFKKRVREERASTAIGSRGLEGSSHSTRRPKGFSSTIHRRKSRQAERIFPHRGKRIVEYAVGDKILRRVHVLSNAAQGFSAKLAPKYEGPYEITAKLAPTVYLLEMEGSRRNTKVHVGELKRYLPPRRIVNGF